MLSARLEASIVGSQVDAPRIGALAELRPLLEARMAEGSPGPRRLELRGHSTHGAQLLRMGATVVDMTDAEVDAFFRELARDGVLRRLGIVELRLLGCGTATQPPGHLTIRLLARVLGLPVYGTTKRLCRHHYTAQGLDPMFEHLLRESSQLPRSRLPPLEDPGADAPPPPDDVAR